MKIPNKINKNNIFYIIYIIYLVYYIVFQLSTYSSIVDKKIITAIQYSIYIMLLIKIAITDKKTVKGWIIFLILNCLALLEYYFSRDIRFFELVLLFYAAKGIDINKFCKINLVLLSFLTVFVMISGLTNTIPNYIFYRNESNAVSDLPRYALGFVYVSQMPFISLEIIFSIIYLNEKNKIRYYIYCLLLAIIVYKLCNVRAVLYFSIIFLILSYAIRKFDFLKNIVVKGILKYSYIWCFVLTMILVLTYNSNNAISVKIDNALNTRISISNRMLDKYEINLFGNQITMYGFSAITNNEELTWDDYSYIDSLYAQLIIKNGIVVTAIVILLNTFILSETLKNKKYYIIGIWLFLNAITAIIDGTVIVVAYNYPILFGLNLLQNKKIKVSNTRKLD